AEAAQPCNRRPPLALEREPRESLIEPLLAGDEAVDGREAVEVGELARWLLEALARKPAPVRLRPGAPFRVDAAVQQQELRDAVGAARRARRSPPRCLGRNGSASARRSQPRARRRGSSGRGRRGPRMSSLWARPDPPSVTWGQPEPVSGQTNPRSVTERVRPLTSR